MGLEGGNDSVVKKAEAGLGEAEKHLKYVDLTGEGSFNGRRRQHRNGNAVSLWGFRL